MRYPSLRAPVRRDALRGRRLVIPIILLSLLFAGLWSSQALADGVGSVLPTATQAVSGNVSQAGNSPALAPPQHTVTPVREAVTQTVGKATAPVDGEAGSTGSGSGSGTGGHVAASDSPAVLENAGKAVTPALHTATKTVREVAAPVLHTASSTGAEATTPVLKTATTVVQSTGGAVAPVLDTTTHTLDRTPVLDTTTHILDRTTEPALQATTRTAGSTVAPLLEAVTRTTDMREPGLPLSTLKRSIADPSSSSSLSAIQIRPSVGGLARASATSASAVGTTAPSALPPSPPLPQAGTPFDPASGPVACHVAGGLTEVFEGCELASVGRASIAWPPQEKIGVMSLAALAILRVRDSSNPVGAPSTSDASSPLPAPSPSPGGTLGAVASATGMAFSIFLTLAGLLLIGGSAMTRRLRFASEPWRAAPFVLIPERPG
jgi:hypothetical protein